MLNHHNNFLFKILVVDNDPYILQILKQKLLFPNYQISVVSTGPEAIVSFKNEQPDLIILDPMLPTLNGYKVCTKLRKESKIPTIIVTSLTELSDHILGFKTGIDDYILKPFIPERLETCVHSLLYRSYKISKKFLFHSNNFFFQFGNFKLNIINQSIVKNGTQIQLTKIE
jgi:OmpR family response regulator RpaB